WACRFRAKAQRLAWNLQYVAAVANHNPQYRSHPREQQEVLVWCGDNRGIGHYVLCYLGKLMDSAHPTRERAVGIGIDRECCSLAWLQPPDICFIDPRSDFHPA